MGNILSIQHALETRGLGPVPPSSFAGGGLATTETGQRTTPQGRIEAITRRFWVDPRLRAQILDIRKMDRRDGRVKKIHNRLARDAIRGGLQLVQPTPNRRVKNAWEGFAQRLKLANVQKLKSDARGLVMEGNLPMQWVLGPDNHVVAGVRMPSETIKPVVTPEGRFKDPSHAFEQLDITTSKTVATFPLWQLTVGRLDPDNYDDHSAMGRPYLDASRETWLKLTMTEEDLVIRRRERAPLRTSHVLEGASEDELMAYKDRVEDDQKDITTNYYSNKRGAVTAVQGDANLDQIADVSYLLDTFFAGGPAPKGLFGYTEGLARDILEDLKRDYYDEVDLTQAELADVYRAGFNLELLLAGINPDAYEFDIRFAERRTETANQAADRALKYQALGLSKTTQIETLGMDPADEKKRLEEEASEDDPYPEPNNINAPPRVSVTPGNARKGESATAISN